jgi:hypothetical protein
VPVCVSKLDDELVYWSIVRYVAESVRDTPSIVVYGSVCDRLKTLLYLPALISAATRLPVPMKLLCTKLPFSRNDCDSE